ncbi:MAG: endo-polygalacturonase [Niabella sp.]|nr:endo-polygalacturonase [Niabella sp.]
MKKIAGVVLLLILYTGAAAQQLRVYPGPEHAPASLHNGDFTVKVRKPGGVWQHLYTYNVKVDEVVAAKHTVRDASLCTFDFSGQVELAVTNNKGSIRSARVRPLSYDIGSEVKGNTLYFKLRKPRNLSVEINGDIFHNLHLFANSVDDFVYNKSDTNVIYFGPGIHDFGKVLKVPSGKTVYVAGGAVLMGQLLVDHAQDVKIMGRGIIDVSVKQGVRIANSKNVLVEGICLTQCPTGGSDNVVIRNVKSISYYGWGDGLNVFASNNVLFDGVFCRNSDDCTTVYGTRGGFTGGCNNIVMENASLWADVAHPILIGTHGNTPHPDTLQNLIYRNIDILDHKEAQVDYQGCMSINAGDNNLVRNVRFENIRVEDFRQGQLVNLRVFFNKKYCTSPGRGIENVLFKDIVYNGAHAELSVIAGYSDDRKIKNIVFENLRINGKLIYDDMPSKPKWYKTSDIARFFVGEHVEDIQFRKQ